MLLSVPISLRDFVGQKGDNKPTRKRLMRKRSPHLFDGEWLHDHDFHFNTQISYAFCVLRVRMRSGCAIGWHWYRIWDDLLTSDGFSAVKFRLWTRSVFSDAIFHSFEWGEYERAEHAWTRFKSQTEAMRCESSTQIERAKSNIQLQFPALNCLLWIGPVACIFAWNIADARSLQKRCPQP